MQNRSHPRIAWKGLELQIYFHENLRGATLPAVSYQQGTLGDWKNHDLGHQSSRKGVVNDVFKNDHYMGFLLRKYRENGQNHTFHPFEPPKWPFLC